MKKLGSILAVVAVVAVLVMWCAGKYNGLVQAEESVSAQWGMVENAYQRRLDLIPNLVQTVKGYAQHEEKTLTEVIEARAKATSVTVDPTNITPEALEAYQSAQNGLSSALGRLLVVNESYPELKADQMFIELQAQLEGTENRIKLERDNYNKVAQGYNTQMRQFPTNIVAKVFGFSQKAYFKADEAAAKAPEVAF